MLDRNSTCKVQREDDLLSGISISKLAPLKMSPSIKHCDHDQIWQLDRSSPHAEVVKYKGFSQQQLFTAATGSRKQTGPSCDNYFRHFPAPLILPGDELAHDPGYPAQSLRLWMNLKERNVLTQQRKTVYIADVPKIASDAPKCEGNGMYEWTLPRQQAAPKRSLIDRPSFKHVLGYLEAFFHGLPMRQLSHSLEFGSVSHDHSGKVHQCDPPRRKGSKTCTCELPEYIALRSPERGISTNIRVRHLHQDETCSPYLKQLSLNDVLDHAIAVLPDDAYCLLLLVDHDLYEDDEDDFCCGRAYGGSRIAVVSSAQYQPALDKSHNVDPSGGHSWPGSHCTAFIQQSCREPQSNDMQPSRPDKAGARRKNKAITNGQSVADAIMIDDDTVLNDSISMDPATPLQAALEAHRRTRDVVKLGFKDLSPAASLYLRRVSLTASHEILHCFGLDHCVYYACAMQGTASMAEDTRQPPYFCPVCENKLAWATLSVSMGKGQAKPLTNQNWWSDANVLEWKRGRIGSLLEFCMERIDRDNGALGFASLAAWLDTFLQKM